jgi:flagellar motility protein MotE (MotC chaperone)
MFRLLPATIITAILLLCVKVVDMAHNTESLLISTVEAQPVEKPSNVSTEKPAALPDQGEEAKKADDKKAEDGKTADDAKKTDEKKPADEERGAKDGKKEKENPAVTKEIGSSTDHRFTAVEVELLQNLAKRREELDRWENNIQIKEETLNATQKRIEDKIQQIEAMKKQVTMLLAQYNTQEDAKIRSLVKIYENMKPVEAARIFDEVEMPILLLVIDSMKEKKVAPILAAMNPKKAKQLTVELANERKINTIRTSGIEQAQPSAESTDAVPADSQAQPQAAADKSGVPNQTAAPDNSSPKSN